MEKLETEFRYLPHSETEDKWGLYVTYAGYEFVPPRYPEAPLKCHPSSHYFVWEDGRVMEDYAVLLTTHGKGIFDDKDENNKVKRRTIHTGNCHLLFPGVWHRYRPSKKTGWHQYAICFNGSYAHQLFKENFFSPKYPILNTGDNEELLHHFKRTVMLILEEPTGFQQMAAAETMQILAQILACMKKKSGGNDRTCRVVKEAKCILNDRCNQEIKVQELARELGVGYSWFSKMFKYHTGLSPVQYHLALRIQAARELLSQTDLSVVSIAYKLGFNCPFYFSRIFKKKTGYSPSGLRNMHKAL